MQSGTGCLRMRGTQTQLAVWTWRANVGYTHAVKSEQSAFCIRKREGFKWRKKETSLG